MRKIILAALLCLSFGRAEAQSTTWGPGPATSPITAIPVAQEQGGTSVASPQFIHWHACEANAITGTANCNIVYMGDSTVYGWLGTGSGGSLALQNVTYYLAQYLQNSGVPSTSGSWCGGSLTAESRLTYDTRISAGSWSLSAVLGLGGFMPHIAAAGTSLVYSPGITVDTFSVIYYAANTAGSMTLTATGGTPTTTNNAQTTGLYTAVATAATPSAINTLTMAWGSGNNIVECVSAYNSTVKSVQIYNAGSWGSTTAAWTGNTNVYDPLKAITYLNPALVIVESGINDPGSLTVAQYTANLNTILASVKSDGADALLVTGNPQGDASVPYFSAARAVAAANGVPIISIDFRWISNAIATALSPSFMSSGGVHPSVAGYSDIGRADYQALKN